MMLLSMTKNDKIFVISKEEKKKKKVRPECE